MSGVEESKGGSKTNPIGTLVFSDDSVVVGPKNERGIPSIKFVEDVTEFVTAAGIEFSEIVGQLHQMHSKYKMMEASLMQRQVNLKKQIPEISKTLSMITFLREKQEAEDDLQTHFNLADNVYAKATVTPCDKVYLWLGAHVMLEYSYDEAEALLTENKTNADDKLVEVTADLKFVRDQVINSQVTMSRLFNWDVRKRRKDREAAAAASA